MIKLTFAKFRSGNYNDKGEYHELYILRDGDGDPLYVGRSVRGAWDRWFENWSSHFVQNGYGEYIPCSPAAKMVSKNAPWSDKWIIELWTREDSIEYLSEILPGKEVKFIRLGELESLMIRRLNPPLNFRIG